MCDQTEIKYVDGDIVWVKFHNFWWPGEVHGESKLPADLLKSFRKMPVAVVKFFQENAYEYVKTINDIYSYNCIRKHEFIKKGLDLHRAKKRNMEKFPEDVRIAEEKTGGNPDIIDSEEFQPEQKPNIANIFGDQTPKGKKGFGRGRRKATPSDDESTYSRVKNLTLKSTHATPTLSAPKSFISSSPAMNRSPAIASTSTSTSTPNPNEFRCHLCNFSTTRLNVIVLHNKTHASETKPIESPLAGKAKKTPIVTSVKKLPPKPRGRKPKPKPNEVEPIPVQNDYESEDILPQTSDSECERKKVPPKKSTKPSPKKRQTKKSATATAASTSFSIDSDEPTTPALKQKAGRKPAKSTRKKIAEAIALAESEKPPDQPVEIKSTLLDDWDEEDDDSMVSASKEVTSELEDIKSVISSPAQSGDENQPKKAIRNIPKKDRRGNILDEFYVKTVPSTNETDTEGEQTVKDDTVVIESDDDICGFAEDKPKVAEIASTVEENKIEPEETVESTENLDEVVESTTNISEIDEVPKTNDEKPKTNDEKSEDDVDLLKQSADLLEETSLLQKNIESVGIIGKKRRLLRKHKNDEDARGSSVDDSVDESAIEEPKEVPLEPGKPIAEKTRGRRRSSAKTLVTSQTVTKTYRSSSRRKTKSSSGDEKGQLQSNDHDDYSVKGNGLDNLPEIDEDVEMKPVESTISTDQYDDDKDTKDNIKIEDDEMSPSKSDFDPTKIEIDCFDFKEEEDEVPQTLNRRKRRCLPPGKVFELQTIDKLEEIRMKEESEKAKRIKLEPEDKEIIISNVSFDEIKNNSSDELISPEKQGEKLTRDDDVKDSKALPPKERGKRIFKLWEIYSELSYKRHVVWLMIQDRMNNLF